MDELPRYQLPKRNFVPPYPRGGGGPPPTPSPYAHLIGREAYEPRHGLFAWLGDKLNMTEHVVLRGVYPRRYLYSLLGRFGVRVRRIIYIADITAPWWQIWRRNTNIYVERYHGMAARAILEDSKFEVMD
jgi:hypothetical protein